MFSGKVVRFELKTLLRQFGLFTRRQGLPLSLSEITLFLHSGSRFSFAVFYVVNQKELAH